MYTGISPRAPARLSFRCESGKDFLIRGPCAAPFTSMTLETNQPARLRRDKRYIGRGGRPGQDGPKSHPASALDSEDGMLCAVAKATWIEIDEPPAGTT